MEIPESLRQRLSYLLGSLYRRVLDLETEALAKVGTGVKQHAALTVLVEEGTMSQQQLGQRLGIDRTTIVSVVDDLERARLVTRTRDEADRRSYLIVPTQDGSAAQQRGQRLVHQAERDLLAALDQPDRAVLTALLARALPES